MKHFALRALGIVLATLSSFCIVQGMSGMFDSHARVKEELRLYKVAYSICSKYSIESEMSEEDKSKLSLVWNAISFQKERSSSTSFRGSFYVNMAAVIAGLVVMFALWGVENYRIRHEKDEQQHD